MATEDKIVCNLQLINPNGKLVQGLVIIIDKKAVSTFQDKYLAFRLFNAEMKAGNKNVEYDDKANALIENYPDKTASEIYNKINRELSKSGGNLRKQ